MCSRRDACESITTRRRLRPPAPAASRRRRRLHAGPRHRTARSSTAPIRALRWRRLLAVGLRGRRSGLRLGGGTVGACRLQGLERIGLLDARRGGLRLDPGRLEGREHLLAGQPLLLRDLVDALLALGRSSESSARGLGFLGWVRSHRGGLRRAARRPRSRRPRPGPPRARRRRRTPPRRLRGSGLGLSLLGLGGSSAASSSASSSSCSASWTSASACSLASSSLLRGRLGLGGLLLALLLPRTRPWRARRAAAPRASSASGSASIATSSS